MGEASFGYVAAPRGDDPGGAVPGKPTVGVLVAIMVSMARQPFFFGNLGSTSPVLGDLDDKSKDPLSHLRRPVKRIVGILISGSKGGKMTDGVPHREPRKLPT